MSFLTKTIESWWIEFRCMFRDGLYVPSKIEHQYVYCNPLIHWRKPSPAFKLMSSLFLAQIPKTMLNIIEVSLNITIKLRRTSISALNYIYHIISPCVTMISHRKVNHIHQDPASKLEKCDKVPSSNQTWPEIPSSDDLFLDLHPMMMIQNDNPSRFVVYEWLNAK